MSIAINGSVRITPKQRGEFIMREYHGDAEWNKTKAELDVMLAFRKSIKGKPDIFQRAELELNALFIGFFNSYLYGANHG